MSHEVDIHSAQTAILRDLLFHPSANFATLQKSTGLDSDHFKFHIKRLLELGYVEKTPDSHYTLTIKGKEYSNKLDTDSNTMERQTKTAALLVIVRENDGAMEVLVQERLKQPFFGFWGRPTGKIRWGETIVEGAKRELLEETGLTADCEVKGIYHKIDKQTESGELLEDKIFYAVLCTNTQGELMENFEGGRNAWMTVTDIKKLPKKFEGIEKDHLKYIDTPFQFDEEVHWYTKEEY